MTGVQEGDTAAEQAAMWADEAVDRAVRLAVLECEVRHVLRYGKVGKNSRARLQAALNDVSPRTRS